MKSAHPAYPLMKNRFNNISVQYNAAGDDLIYGYKNELIQVIIILLSNAVDAFDKKNVKNRLIVINTDVSQERALIEIEDNAGVLTLKILPISSNHILQRKIK